MEITSLGEEFFRVDIHKNRRTDMTKLIVDFRNFTTAPKNLSFNIV
jgi:hypothetical protein